MYFIEYGAVEVLAASASLHQETNTVTTATAASSNTTVLTGNSGGDADALRSNNIGGSCGGDGTGSALEVQGVGLSGPQPGPLSLSQARPPRVNKISAGGIFGEAAFFLDFPQSVRCVALQAPPSPSSTWQTSSTATRLASTPLTLTLELLLLHPHLNLYPKVLPLTLPVHFLLLYGLWSRRDLR